MSTVGLVLPCYNEYEAMAVLLPSLLTLPVHRIMVVDDGDDGTEALVHGYRRIDPQMYYWRGGERGLSGAIRCGARLLNTDYVMVMDTDGQHSVLDAAFLLTRLGNQDIVIGSRFLPYSHILGMSWRRIMLSRLLICLTNATSCNRVSDPMSGLFIAKQELITRTQNDGFKILYSILKHNRHLNVEEYPIALCERIGGTSKANWKEMVHLFKQMTIG